MQSISEVLGNEGALAKTLQGYKPRPQQQQMAEQIEQALADHAVLVAEAGTGTGKTFAYLVPALLSGKKVMVSTGTKNLQDQLFHKDLPLVRKALGVPVDIALLKGRANYLCLHRLQLSVEEGRFLNRKQVSHLQDIRRWADRTRSGDISELSDLPEDSPLWPMVTSTAENCLGSECAELDDCHLAHARRRAQEADLLVVNHHLLFADMALKEEGFGELLPGANAIILDEAHQLPETASNFFGVSITANQIIELARDSIAEELKEAGDAPELTKQAEQLEKAVRDLRLCMGLDSRRGPWAELLKYNKVDEGFELVANALQSLCELLEEHAARGKGLQSCHERCEEMSARFNLLISKAGTDSIHWYETFTRSFSLNLTPLDVAPMFQKQMEGRPCAWIFTSATLAVGHQFDHFCQRMGLQEARTCQWDSPFDYPHQAVLYVPEGLPEPSDSQYTREIVKQALDVLKISRGRAFMLFTSHRALQEAAELLEEEDLPYPLLVQGDQPRARLLERFRQLGNAVLLGTGSFWEGVDVRGEALSCVIIDKLPFASPGDPILQARIDAMREQGKNPFMDYQIPQAAITLKQGVGRLIRDIDDRGLLMLCDQRIVSKHYGKIFLDSLPPMTRTRKLDVVERFFSLERPVKRA